MNFEVSAEAYGRFMGRYSEPLAVRFARFAGVEPGGRALDVGCGPGALTGELVRILGAGSVSAVDPSRSFAAAASARFPGIDVTVASAERLPEPDGVFDFTMAQLVVHFMDDPVAGLREMARVTRPGGVVAACVWDHGARGPVTAFWRAVRELDPGARGESDMPGAREGDLVRLFAAAGLTGIREDVLTVEARFPAFEQWWEPFTLGVGPAGAYVAQLGTARRAELRDRCASLLGGEEPFGVTASAWAAVGRRALMGTGE
ncbi:class I SAM-dependent methyltransferase [Actinoplanes utahensis]|uniref:SAM-dependent methlyltransferase n=1 Tax=Actinoplanes utahensis TaxID=1869 RepID=A0A0A6UKP5_ACTUT|nr:class I SAM-dependent methyltransferase [Actinoplanes utahensis]KHD74874.1 SAM-dependent methlyltransferase [Actinoplanes utahensis]GIF30785.1 methyltransferase [Actinoplanes utahensis]